MNTNTEFRQGSKKLNILLVILFLCVIVMAAVTGVAVGNNKTFLSNSNTQVEKPEKIQAKIRDENDTKSGIEENNTGKSNENAVQVKTDEHIDTEKSNKPAEAKEEVINAVNVENAYVKDGKKTVYLTFDDGPSIITPKILDILLKNNIKATFFVIGNIAESHPDIVKRTLKEGHSIGNHTYSHNYKQVYYSKENFANELKMTDHILKQILGQEFSTRLFRFPGGSFEKNKQPLKEVLTQNNYTYIDWNALNGDSETQNPTGEGLVKRIKETSGDKEKVVILMHDAAAKQATLQSLPDVITYFQSRGYEFKSLK